MASEAHKSGAYMRGRKKQLPGGWKKYEFPETQLDIEKKLKTMGLSEDQASRELLKQAKVNSTDPSIDPKERDEWAKMAVHIESRQTRSKIQQDFIEDFCKWLTGRSQFNVKEVREWAIDKDTGSRVEIGFRDCTPWGNKPLVMLPGVTEFLDQGPDKRGEVIKELTKLKMNGPRNIDEAYIYYKYLVRGCGISDNTVHEFQFLQQFDYPHGPYNPDNDLRELDANPVFGPEGDPDRKRNIDPFVGDGTDPWQEDQYQVNLGRIAYQVDEGIIADMGKLTSDPRYLAAKSVDQAYLVRHFVAVQKNALAASQQAADGDIQGQPEDMGDVSASKKHRHKRTNSMNAKFSTKQKRHDFRRTAEDEDIRTGKTQLRAKAYYSRLRAHYRNVPIKLLARQNRIQRNEERSRRAHSAELAQRSVAAQRLEREQRRRDAAEQVRRVNEANPQVRRQQQQAAQQQQQPPRAAQQQVAQQQQQQQQAAQQQAAQQQQVAQQQQQQLGQIVQELEQEEEEESFEEIPVRGLETKKEDLEEPWVGAGFAALASYAPGYAYMMGGEFYHDTLGNDSLGMAVDFDELFFGGSRYMDEISSMLDASDEVPGTAISEELIELYTKPVKDAYIDIFNKHVAETWPGGIKEREMTPGEDKTVKVPEDKILYEFVGEDAPNPWWEHVRHYGKRLESFLDISKDLFRRTAFKIAENSKDTGLSQKGVIMEALTVTRQLIAENHRLYDLVDSRTEFVQNLLEIAEPSIKALIPTKVRQAKTEMESGPDPQQAVSTMARLSAHQAILEQKEENVVDLTAEGDSLGEEDTETEDEEAYFSADDEIDPEYGPRLLEQNLESLSGEDLDKAAETFSEAAKIMGSYEPASSLSAGELSENEKRDLAQRAREYIQEVAEPVEAIFESTKSLVRTMGTQSRKLLQERTEELRSIEEKVNTGELTGDELSTARSQAIKDTEVVVQVFRDIKKDIAAVERAERKLKKDTTPVKDKVKIVAGIAQLVSPKKDAVNLAIHVARTKSPAAGNAGDMGSVQAQFAQTPQGKAVRAILMPPLSSSGSEKEVFKQTVESNKDSKEPDLDALEKSSEALIATQPKENPLQVAKVPEKMLAPKRPRSVTATMTRIISRPLYKDAEDYLNGVVLSYYRKNGAIPNRNSVETFRTGRIKDGLIDNEGRLLIPFGLKGESAGYDSVRGDSEFPKHATPEEIAIENLLNYSSKVSKIYRDWPVGQNRGVTKSLVGEETWEKITESTAYKEYMNFRSSPVATSAYETLKQESSLEDRRGIDRARIAGTVGLMNHEKKLSKNVLDEPLGRIVSYIGYANSKEVPYRQIEKKVRIYKPGTNDAYGPGEVTPRVVMSWPEYKAFVPETSQDPKLGQFDFASHRTSNPRLEAATRLAAPVTAEGILYAGSWDDRKLGLLPMAPWEAITKQREDGRPVSKLVGGLKDAVSFPTRKFPLIFYRAVMDAYGPKSKQ